MPITLVAPTEGNLVYDNSKPIQIYALNVARDPNLSSLLPGDQEFTYSNNWAYSTPQGVSLVYNDPNPSYFTVDPLFQNNMPQGNVLGPDGQQVSTTGGGEINLQSTYNGTTVDHVRLTWDTSQGSLVVDGRTVTPTLINGGPRGYYDLSAGDFDKAAFQSSITNSDVDFSQVTADIYGPGPGSLLGTATYTPVVDAVAQVPTSLTSTTDYGNKPGGAPYTAVESGQPADIVVQTTFHDLAPHSDRYVLVQYQPGWSLPPGTSYDIITGTDGKQYWQVPVQNSDIGPGGVATVHVSVIPPASGGASVGNGQSSFNVATGAMTVRHPTGGSDQEPFSDNNVSYNLTGGTTVITSTAESNPAINVTPTYAGDDSTGTGVPNPNLSSNIYITGLNQSSDDISRVTLTYSNANGDLVYNGTTITGSTPGVTIIPQQDGTVQAVIDNANIISALLQGSAGHSAVQYVPKNYNDTDVPVSASFTVNDLFSPDSKTVNSNTTIIVDAVALQPRNVGISITDPNYNGAVDSGVSVPFSVTATFIDMDNPRAQHYLAIQQLSGWNLDGPLPPEIAIETYNGVTYYLISADLFGNNESPYLTNNGNGTYTFNVSLRSPAGFANDQANAATIQGGAVSIINPIDTGITFDNNTSVVSEQLPLNIGVVQTKSADFVIAPITEDSAAGAAIALEQADKDALTTNNEKITQTTLTFNGTFTGYSAGTQVGTVIYDGKAYAVNSNGNGTASATIPFGAGGYDASKDFNVVWGTVATNGNGDVQYAGGLPKVDTWNHTGSNMTVSSVSTVVDKASGAAKTTIPGSGSVQFVPTADAPTDLEATAPAMPVGANAPVTFTVSGKFADTDGSEQHYFLVQQLDGWTGNYQTTFVNGKSYFMVPVSSSSTPDPSVNVTLNTPPGITTDGAYTLEVSGMSVDGASTNTSTIPASTTVNVGVVNATGVSLTMNAQDENVSSQMLFNWRGTPVNDAINNITITDLQGGSIVDSMGNVLFANAPAVLDGSRAFNGDYWYLPPQYGSGTYTLTYTAKASDKSSGAVTSFTGQTGSVVINPITTQPLDPTGTSGIPAAQPGHQAQVSVTLNAVFPDNDNSESHFFLVTFPPGIAVPAGLIQVTAASNPTLYNAAVTAGMNAPFYMVGADATGKAVFNVMVPENQAAPGSIVFMAGASENALNPPVYKFTGQANAVLPATGPINVAPDSVDQTQTVPDTNNAAATGNIPLTDQDPTDTVAVTAVTFDGTTLSDGGGGVYTATVSSGTLSFNSNTGNYTFTANGSGSGTYVLNVTVSDGNGGVSTSTVTFNVGTTTRSAAVEVADSDHSNSQLSFAASDKAEEQEENDTDQPAADSAAPGSAVGGEENLFLDLDDIPEASLSILDDDPEVEALDIFGPEGSAILDDFRNSAGIMEDSSTGAGNTDQSAVLDATYSESASPGGEHYQENREYPDALGAINDLFLADVYDETKAAPVDDVAGIPLLLFPNDATNAENDVALRFSDIFDADSACGMNADCIGQAGTLFNTQAALGTGTLDQSLQASLQNMVQVELIKLESGA